MESNWMREMGHRAADLRRRRGWSEFELATRSGLRADAVVMLEQGHPATPLRVVERVCRALRVSPADLAGRHPLPVASVVIEGLDLRREPS